MGWVALTGAVEPLKGKAFWEVIKWWRARPQKEIMIVPEKQTCPPPPMALYLCVPVVEGSSRQSCSEVMSSLR